MMSLRALICSVWLLAVLDITYSINKPPNIIVPNKPRTDYTVYNPGDPPFVLNCDAEGTPEPKYRWKFNGQIINNVGIKVDKITGELSIEKFTIHEEGQYQCIAENEIASGKVAVALSPVITVKKLMLGSVWEGGDIPIRGVKEGDYFEMTCDNQPISVPVAEYSWSYVEDTDNKPLEITDRLFIDAKGSLHFNYLLKSDELDGKTYKCGLFNHKLDMIKLGSGKTLHITAAVGAIPQVAARIQFHTNPARFLRTKVAQLECVFSGNPNPTIKWFKSDKEIHNSEKYEIPADSAGRKLLVKNLDEDDEDIYKCVGSNSKGDNDMTIFLDVYSGPIWVESLSSQTIAEGKNAVFKCKARPARGEDELNAPQWFKNGKIMTVSSDGKYEFSDNSRVLTIKNLTKNDITCFQCNVSNAYGYEFGDGCLNVIDPIKIIKKPALLQNITRGDWVNLTVLATTDPALKLKYRWRFNNRTYDDPLHPPFVVFNETNFEAYINTSALEEKEYLTVNGTYYREIYHEYDSITIPIQVMLKELPPVVAPIAAASVDLWWIALIVAVVILFIVILMIAIICNRKRQEGTYPLDKKERANDIDPEKDLADSGFHDLSRQPEDSDYPTKKYPTINPNFDYGDDMDVDDDESLMEYGGGDIDTTKFNEDGSFIGQYTSKKAQEVKHSPPPINHHATESQI